MDLQRYRIINEVLGSAGMDEDAIDKPDGFGRAFRSVTDCVAVEVDGRVLRSEEIQ